MSRRRVQPKILREAHGNGADAVLRAEAPALDELPPPNAELTARGLAMAAERGKPFAPGNRAAANRKPALALLGVPIATADPRYRQAMRKAAAWRSRRVRELTVMCGGYLGTGPATMIASAALALAASRVAYELAAEAGAKGLTLAKLGADLAEKARSAELSAIGVAEREAAAREAARRVDPIAEQRMARVLEERRQRARQHAHDDDRGNDGSTEEPTPR